MFISQRAHWQLREPAGLGREIRAFRSLIIELLSVGMCINKDYSRLSLKTESPWNQKTLFLIAR